MRKNVIRRLLSVILTVSLLVPLLGALPDKALAASVPTVETRPANFVSETAAIINGRIVSDGGSAILERRFSWGRTSSCSDGWTATVGVSGDYFSYYLTGLNPGTTYYFQTWARSSAGWGVGSAVSFTTSQPASPPLSFTSLTPSSITTSQSTYTAALTAMGANFNNVNQVTFTWSGPDSGSRTWTKGDASWNAGVVVGSDTYMTLYPRVLYNAGGSQTLTWSWTVTLRDSTGATKSRSFTVTYIPPTTPLSFSSLTPSSITTDQSTYTATLSATGTNFNNVNQVTFTWSGPDSGTKTWTKGDSSWNAGVVVGSDTYMTLYPRVLYNAGGSQTLTWSWTVTLRDTTGATASRTFTVTYNPPSTPLSFTSLTPSAITTSTAPYDATLSATGTNFNNVNRVTFTWSGAASGSAVWDKGTSDWNNKVTVNSDTSMTLRPRVVETSPTWCGTVTWTVTLRDTTRATASRSFTVGYEPALPDLIVEDIQITPDPPVAGSGATMIIITIRNVGNGAAVGAFYLELYFDDVYQGRVTVSGLNAGSTYTSTWSAIKWPSDYTLHTIRGMVDSTNTISESSEGNNERLEQFAASGPVNVPPILSNGYVTPSFGDTSTVFNYYVTYTDVDNDAPGICRYIYIDSVAYMMTQISGSYTLGAVFKYSTTLPPGNHNYYFYFNDAYGHLVWLPASGTYSGPSVTASNQPPTAFASEISGQPETMHPYNTYSVTTRYHDPNGRDNLKYCYLRLNHPSTPLTMMWDQSNGNYGPWAGEEGEYYMSITSVTSKALTDGYELSWSFELRSDWPGTDYAIDFGVYACDDGDMNSGWHYDDTNASFTVQPFLPALISPLSITPVKETYEIGETLTAQFTIRNQGSLPFTLDTLTVGGRCNGWCLSSGCPDFSYDGVTLHPDETYQYQGNLVIPKSGTYLFFVAYHIDSPTSEEAKLLGENNWNTSVDLGTGLTPADRTRTVIVPQTKEEVDLSTQIDRLLAITTQYPPYLLTPEGFLGSVAIVWMDWTAWATQTELNEKYDELYFTGIDYDCTSRIALANAKAALNRGDIEIAQEYVQDYFLYNKLSLMSFNAATQYFQGMAGAAEMWAEGIRDGCQTAIKFGLTFISPEAAKVADYFFIFSDFVVDYYFRGQDEALKDALVKASIAALFNEIKLAPGGRTLENYIGNRVGKVTFPLLQTWIKSGQWQFFLSKSLKYGANWLSEEVAEEVALLIIDALEKGINSIESQVRSPVELRVYDSQGNATGLFNGQIEHGIPRSMCDNERVIIFFPSSPCTYYSIGKDEGVYGLDVFHDEGGDTDNFGARDVSISVGAVDQYMVDWDAIARGEPGITIKKDYNGDGEVDEYISSGAPDTPINPSPVHGTTQASLNATLGWMGDDSEFVTYDVYFGTDINPPLVSGRQTETSYVTVLNLATTYYWKIVTVDEHGMSSTSPLWHFTTRGFRLTTSGTEGGRVVIPGEGVFPYDVGGTVDLVAEPNEGYRFVRWTGDVDAIANVCDANTTINMSDHYSITANFVPEGVEPIWDWCGLDAIRHNVSGSYLLMNNLDSTTNGYAELAGQTANEGKGWEPIGTSDNPFTGSFNGQEYEIKDMLINRPDELEVALFGYVGGNGEIANVGVINASVTGYWQVGSLVGGNHGGTVNNCYSSANVSGSREVGGLVGWSYGEAIVNDCYSAGSVRGTDNSFGGLLGWAEYGTVSDCHSSANVSGPLYVGGLVGFNDIGAVIRSYATGSVSGGDYVGGLVGANWIWTITDCYSTGSVSGNDYVGGLVGENGGLVSNSHSTGSVNGSLYVGGLVGWDEGGTVSNSFWDMETSGTEVSDGGTGKMTAEMVDIATFTDTATEGLDEPWDVVAVAPGESNPAYTWNMVDGETYPFLTCNLDEIIVFPDRNLELAIREAIGVFGRNVYQFDLDKLTLLNAEDRDIVNLTGLEHCTNLISLNIHWNQITDISPLANLTNLTTLLLGGNQVNDIQALSNLTNLTTLLLGGNQVNDIQALSNLTNLTDLDLGSNQITDISPLANLTTLTHLNLVANQITDISPLASLNNLTSLHLWGTQMGDSDLLHLAKLTNLADLGLSNNQISDISSLANLTNLTGLYLSYNEISDISPLASFTNLINVDLRSNQVSDILPLVNNPGLSVGDTVDLRGNPLSPTSINTWIPELVARGVKVLYDMWMPIPAHGLWTRAGTPSMQGRVLAPDSTIIDYAVSDGGVVAYAVVEQAGQFYLLRSTDSAATWQDITAQLEAQLYEGESIIELLRVASDAANPGFLAVALKMYDGIAMYSVHVYISNDGGVTFGDAGKVEDGGVYLDIVTDLVVTPESGGNRDIFIGGTVNSVYGAGLFHCSVTGDSPSAWHDATDFNDYKGWDNMDPIDAPTTGDILSWLVTDIIVSPHWGLDATVLVTTVAYDWVTGYQGVYMQSGSFGSSPGWNEQSTLGIEAVEIKTDNSHDILLPTALASIDARGIAGLLLPEDYNSKNTDERVLWVWVNYWDWTTVEPMCDIIRVDDDSAHPVGPVGQIEDGELWLTNISYHGTIAEGEAIAGVLGVGGYDYMMGDPDDLWITCCDGVQVYRNDGIRNMDICCVRWHDACKPPTGNGAIAVTYVGDDKVYAVVLGSWYDYDEGGWSVSFDDGDVWNQLSLVDTHIDYLSDVAVSPDCSNMMLVSVNWNSGYGCDSVWLNAEDLAEAPEYSGKWLRTWCSQLEGVNEESSQRGLLRLAPDEGDGSTVYLIDRGTNNVYWNNLKTLACWEKGIATVDNIVDLAVKDATTIYALDANGDVAMSDDYGFSLGWHEPVFSGVVAAWTIAVRGDDILVGCCDGDISYSDDGGETFTELQGLPTGGNFTLVTLAFDSYFEQNNTIYAAVAWLEALEVVSQDMAGGIYRWVVGESTEWEDLNAASCAYTGLVLDKAESKFTTSADTGGILYASYVAEASGELISGVARCLTPGEQSCCEGTAWDYLDEGLAADMAFAMMPSALKMCSSLIPPTNPTLFAIGFDTGKWEYDMENDTYGTVWKFIDAPRTWYVDDDLVDYPDADFTAIQDAVDEAGPGDTIIVYPGTYTENIIIGKSVNLIGEDRDTTIIDANAVKKGIFIDAIDISINCLIQGFMIRNSGEGYDDGVANAGIVLHTTGKGSFEIKNNIITDNRMGVLTDSSALLTDNIISNNSHSGIFTTQSCSDATITNNLIYGCEVGIYVHSQSNPVTIVSNTISDNSRGLLVERSGNLIYINDFLDNEHNVASSSDLTNIWNSPEEITYTYNGNTCTSYLGNYWSDYLGSDLDGDGIGETPYEIDSDADNYPLVEPFENYEMGGNITPKTTNLVLYKSDSGGQGYLHFDLLVSNDGTAAAGNVTLVDTLPWDLYFDYASDKGIWSEEDRTVTWYLGTVEADSSRFLSLDVSCPYWAFGENHASVTTTTTESNYEDNEAVGFYGSWPEHHFDFWVSGPSGAAQSSEITYSLSYQNLCWDWDAENVQIVYTMAPEVSFVSASDGGTYANGEVTWDLGTGPLDYGEVMVTVKVADDVPIGSKIVNAAYISSTNEFPYPIDNYSYDECYTTVLKGANLILSKTCSSTKEQGSVMTYTIHYQNFGTEPAENVVISDTLPSEVVYVLSSNGGDCPASPGNIVTWNMGSVGGLGHGSVSVTVEIGDSIPVGTVITNQATINSTTPETCYDDNEAVARTTIVAPLLPANVGVEPTNGGTTSISVDYNEPITFSFDSCEEATSVDIHIHIDDGGPDIYGAMMEGPAHHWTYNTTFFPRYGDTMVTYTVYGCPGRVEEIDFSIYIDPAGYVYDVITGLRIEDATVWLQRPDGADGWENIPTGANPANMNPDVNPLVTGVDGQYQWNVLEGSYRVHVEAVGYYSTDSIVVSIPPPVTDLHMGLIPLNQPPIADAGPDQSVCATAPNMTALVMLDGSSSHDPDGDALTYNWTWDGNTAYGVNPIVELPTGNTTITLVVNDGKVDSEPDTVDINVKIPATIDFNPNVLNLKSKGNYVSVYIELPPGYDLSKIDIASVSLNSIVPALSKATKVGDYDRDGIPDLMFKFDRAAVQATVEVGELVEITVTGEIEGMQFEGTTIIRVID